MAEHRCSQCYSRSAAKHYLQLVARHRSQMVTREIYCDAFTSNYPINSVSYTT